MKTGSGAEVVSIIPLPVEIQRQSGEFRFNADTVIVADRQNEWNALYLRDLVAPASAFDLPVRVEETGRDPHNVIRLAIGGGQEELGREGYALVVSPEEIAIRAPQTAGVFYGIQTLRQLLPAEIEKRTLVPGAAWRVPCVTVKDSPRFEWRGYMLDEGRHFHGKETVLRTLELMALQKLNVLHWHLTEDQGWRIEIKQYPRLTEIGATRKGTTKGFMGKHNGIPHGGFYTQEDIKEIVAFATERHINILPEIEMPGHSLAALAAYPELSCTGKPLEVACRFGIHSDVYCAGKEAVFGFLQNVLDEVVALFPFPLTHIGGDEAPKRRWKKCPDCQNRIKDEGLTNEQDLHRYVSNRIAAHLASRGRRIVGWNDVLHEGLEESAVLQYWIRHRKRVMRAIQGGRDVIVSSFWHLYLDHSYSLTPLSKAYNFEPVFPGLNAQDAQHILGLEAPLWTEFVPDRARLDYQTYPRLTAFAETGWSAKQRKDWEDFQRRLAAFLLRLDALGVRYARGRDVEPPWFKRLLGILTIARPQTRTAAPLRASERSGTER